LFVSNPFDLADPDSDSDNNNNNNNNSGKSYYGEDSLYYMTPEGKLENVSLPKEGPIHATSWSPTGKEFLVVYGFMPSQSTLFGVDCKPKCEFGTGPRNTINWDPFGRIVCISGFGNLQGEMDFWDVRKLKKVGTATAHCSSHFEWAPDGTHVLTAVLSPRIRVDNGYKLWSCDGRLLHQEQIDELLRVSWRPAPLGIFPEPRPPPPLAASASSSSSSSSGAAKTPTSSTNSSAPVPAAPAKYRHPNFSGREVVVREKSAGPVKYSAAKAAAAPKKALPAGAVFVSKSANKNKKKRENKKKQEETAAATTTESEETTEETNLSREEIEKKIKLLNKKLRQIGQLKEQVTAGKVLDAAQLEKLNVEAAISQQLSHFQALQLNNP
jgi:translation initiation factor 2A